MPADQPEGHKVVVDAKKIVAEIGLESYIKSLPPNSYSVLVTVVPTDHGVDTQSFIYPPGRDNVAYHGAMVCAADHLCARLSGNVD
jgi:hypothetical protein